MDGNNHKGDGGGDLQDDAGLGGGMMMLSTVMISEVVLSAVMMILARMMTSAKMTRARMMTSAKMTRGSKDDELGKRNHLKNDDDDLGGEGEGEDSKICCARTVSLMFTYR